MRRAEPLAGLGGILLFVALFLPWYEVRLSPADAAAAGLYKVEQVGDNEVLGLLSTFTTGPALTSWRVFTVIDVLLALLAVLALAVPLVSLLAREPAKPIAIAVLASALGWLAVLLVALRLVFPPGDLALRYGAWLALAGAVIAWAGSWLSMRDESTPGAVAPNIPVRPAPGTA